MSLSPSSSPSSSSSSAAAAVTTTSMATAIPLSTALATIDAPSPITALPASNPSPNSVSRRGLPPPCWTNDETLALIESYKEKWYSLNRSNLRAAHWDDVAAAVASRSLQIPAATPKTAVQCRHKIEKLRKRYRSERQRSLAHNPNAPPSSPWIFFRKMDQMENPNPNPNWYQETSDGSGGGGGGMKFKIPKAARTLGGNPNRASWYRGCDDDGETEQRRSGGSGGSLKFKIPKAVRSSCGNPNFRSKYKAKSSYSVKPGLEEMRRRVEMKRRREEEEEEEDEGEGGEDSSSMGEVARVLRMFGDGYMRMERMKMEMARDMERARMEMELKRTEMILDAQKRIVDAFVKGVVSKKEVKRSSDS